MSSYEPGNRARPRQLGGSFVVTLGSGIAKEAVHGARIDVTLVGNVRGRQGLVVRRPGGCQALIECSLVDQDRSLDLR